MADGFVSVSRRIEAPAEELFALIASPTNHPLIDGSGMVRQPAPPVTVSGAGDVFLMNMHHDRWRDAMTALLVKLELLAKAMGAM
jgi:hypothetical protein